MEDHSTEYLNVRAVAASALSRHTNWDVRPREIEIAIDPNDTDLIAIQVRRYDGTHHFLYDRSIGASSMTRVQFPSWPPRFGKLKT